MVKALLLVAVEVLSLMALWRAGALLDPINPIDRMMAILRVVAIVWMAWTTYSTIAILSSSRPRFTNRLARALVHRAVAAAIVTGVAAAPTPAFAVIAQIDSSGVAIPPGAFVRTASSERPVAANSASVRSETSVVVEPGDNLWRIAERRVRSIEADPTPRLIARYWARLVATNSRHLRSGNPDLIYPGEVIELP
jgi:nucleoid-associated protein YgaU